MNENIRIEQMSQEMWGVCVQGTNQLYNGNFLIPGLLMCSICGFPNICDNKPYPSVSGWYISIFHEHQIHKLVILGTIKKPLITNKLWYIYSITTTGIALIYGVIQEELERFGFSLEQIENKEEIKRLRGNNFNTTL